MSSARRRHLDSSHDGFAEDGHGLGLPHEATTIKAKSCSRREATLMLKRARASSTKPLSLVITSRLTGVDENVLDH
jgi:hypothetical protein